MKYMWVGASMSLCRIYGRATCIPDLNTSTTPRTISAAMSGWCAFWFSTYTFGNNNKSAGVPWYQRSEKCLKMIKWILGFFSSLSFPLELLDARNMVSFFVASPSGSLTCPSWRKVSWFRSFRCQLAAAGALSISRLDLLVRGGAALRMELHCGGALKSTVELCGTKRLTRERESCPCTNAPLLQPL